jgi:hypothetical protein
MGILSGRSVQNMIIGKPHLAGSGLVSEPEDQSWAGRTDTRAGEALLWTIQNVGKHVLLAFTRAYECTTESVVKNGVAGTSVPLKWQYYTHVKVMRLAGGLGLSSIPATQRAFSVKSS